VRRTLQNALALLQARAAGVTLVTVDRWTIAEELWSFGEDELYLAALDLSDKEMIRVWRLAGRLYMNGGARSGFGQAGEAAALAAVATLERRKRPLARQRRRPKRNRPEFGRTLDERLEDVYRIEDGESFPAAWR
jgi:hypothetical protein